MHTKNQETDVILIGAGIMSATLGMLLKELQPNIQIQIYERLDRAAAESSDAWNNAGTGHAAFCELNYTPELADGSVETLKATKISESFEVSRQFWTYLVQKNILTNPENFIKNVPHLSFVWGAKNVSFLKKRHQALHEFHLFKEMEYSEDFKTIENWAPLVMKDRKNNEPVAATYMKLGTDVNFGNLTRSMFQHLESLDGVSLHFNHEVSNLTKKGNKWAVKTKNLNSNSTQITQTSFVFIGAGGESLLLLEKANIPEGKGYGGFPVGGQWLKCINTDVIKQHHTKVYGKASVGAPPMSVPHIDTRIIDGKQALLFGPYAGFSTKFLKTGSYCDLFKSIQLDNIKPMIQVAFKNIPLTKYLIEQVFQSNADRLNALKEYVPSAKEEDWVLEKAGQRVQVIKKNSVGKGTLEFGTEVITSKDGSLAALLGASPGASTAVSIMLQLIESCFPKEYNTEEWQKKIKEIIPSYGELLNENTLLCDSVRKNASHFLKL